jgi:hypothetical protein
MTEQERSNGQTEGSETTKADEQPDGGPLHGGAGDPLGEGVEEAPPES